MDCPNCGGPMILTDHVYRCSPCRGKYLERLKSPHRLIIETANEIAIELAMAKNKIDIGEDRGLDYFQEARLHINKAIELAADIKDISRSQQGIEPVIVVGSFPSYHPEKTDRASQKYLSLPNESSAV